MAIGLTRCLDLDTRFGLTRDEGIGLTRNTGWGGKRAAGADGCPLRLLWPGLLG